MGTPSGRHAFFAMHACAMHPNSWCLDSCDLKTNACGHQTFPHNDAKTHLVDQLSGAEIGVRAWLPQSLQNLGLAKLIQGCCICQPRHEIAENENGRVPSPPRPLRLI